MGLVNSTSSNEEEIKTSTEFDSILFPEDSRVHRPSIHHIEFDVSANKVSMSMGQIASLNLAKMLSRTPKELLMDNNARDPSESIIPQAFSILEYSLSDFETVMLWVATFLDCRELCRFSSVCKLFRKIESDNKEYLWQNLYRSHKINMMCLSTNPFHALKSFEESKRFRALQNRGPNPHSPVSPIDDPLQELSAVIGDWKEACLKYVFVKRKLVSESHEYAFLRNLSQQFKQQQQQQNSESKGNTSPSDESRRSRRTSRKILKTFRDSDEEDDFGDDWDSDESDDKPLTPLNKSMSENKLSLSLDLARKLTPRPGDEIGDNEEGMMTDRLTRRDSYSFSTTPITAGFFNKMGMLTSRRIFDTTPNSTEQPNSNNESSDDLERNDSLKLSQINITVDDNNSFDSQTDDGINHLDCVNIQASNQEADSDSWGLDSESDETNSIIVVRSNSPGDHDKTMSISAITLDIIEEEEKDTSAQVAQEEYQDTISITIDNDVGSTVSATTFSPSKLRMLNRYNDDDEEDDFGGDEDNSFDDTTESTWDIKEPLIAPEPISLRVNNDKQQSKLSAFCDDDEDTEDDDLAFTSSPKINFAQTSDDDDDDETTFDELVKQEVLEQETLTVDDLITNLTNESRLKETYLSLSNAATQKFHSQLYSLIQKTRMDEELSSITDNMPEVIMEPNEWPTTLSFYSQKKGQGVRVKVVFIESIHTPNPAKLCHPLVKQLGSTDECLEYLYPALIIGPWLLQWNPHHSLVIPRKMTSGLMAVQARIHKVTEIFSLTLEEVVNIIAPEIVRWNTGAIHDLRASNGQHFIDRILTSLNMGDVLKKNRIGRTLANYIGIMREEGRAIMVFELDSSDPFYRFLVVDDQTISEGDIPQDRYVRYFPNHKELDEFARQLISNNSNYTTVRCSDYSLLVIFDLAYWYKHQYYPDHPSYKPLKKDILRGDHLNAGNSILCPYGHNFD